MPFIDDIKDQQLASQPLLVYTFTFSSGTVLRVATHPLNVAEGGIQYGGVDYFGRVERQDLEQIQQLSEQGIDLVPSISIHLADADKFLLTNYEQVHGFKGATVTADFVFYDVDAGTFSTDSIRKFTGVCDTPEITERNLSMSARAKLNLQRTYLPVVPIQRRCPWINPVTTAQRATANDEDSDFFECGETRDLVTAPPCSYTNETCTQPLRRGNITWDPPAGGRSREYTSGKWLDISNNPNQAKYGDYFPVVYGTGWVEPPVLNMVGDGNSTRGESVICVGEVQNILKVIVNDQELPAANSMDGGNYLVLDPLFRYNVINRGTRNGAPNADTPYNGQGDPYGSLCAILWVVYRKVADTNSTPRVRVLVQGPKVRVYTGPSTYTKQYSNNPIWILLDLLTWTNYKYAEIDIQTFIDAAAYCDQSVTYTGPNGTSVTHPRYACNVILRQRRSASEVIRAVRQACNAILVPSSFSGKLQVFLRQTLAVQQPAVPLGTNYGTAVTSKNAAGAVANGYVAYSFDETNIIRRDNGELAFRILPRISGDSPNRVTFTFQDEEYLYAGSSMSVVDPDDVIRSQQETSQALTVEGIPNYDQANRIAKMYLAEVHRGNESGDTRGTRYFEFDTTFRAVRLRIGQICRISVAKYNLTGQLFRVTKIQPSANGEYFKITGHWHNDNWYTDAYGQSGQPSFQSKLRDRLERPSYPWGPYAQQPITGNALYDAEDWGFSLQTVYEAAADGTAIAQLIVSGRKPVNDFAVLKPPLVQPQGTTANTGGSIVGGGWVYFAAVCAVDAGGKLSPHSAVCQIAVTQAGTVNTITIPVVSWDSATVNWQVFVGRTPARMVWQASGTGTPASITITAWKPATYGAPDGEFDRLLVKIKRVFHSGVWGGKAVTVGVGTLAIPGIGWTVNEWAGYDVSLLAKGNGAVIPIADFRVVSNTSDTLTVTPDPTGIVTPADIIVMRSKPSVSGLTLADPRWANSLASPTGLTVNEETGRTLRIIAGPGRGDTYRIDSNTATSITVEGPWRTVPTSESRYIIEEPGWLQDQVDSTPQTNPDVAAEIALKIPVENYKNSQLWVQAFTVDGGGNESIDQLSPGRDVYQVGNTGNVGENADVIIEY